MVDERTYLRIREGTFTYLLAVEPSTAVEPRDAGALEPAGDDSAPVVAWHRAADGRVPVVRLGQVLGTRVGPWGHAILLGGGPPIGVAAEHVDALPAGSAPDILPFNPAGCSLPDGSPIIGVCRGTEPERLVLDPPRLLRNLRRTLAS
ncbi:MAG TPA: hypothetical protein VK973_02380 [Arenicellales bacterium]|nr:hypothetical protein [Arenicellales bacterium]